MGLENTLSILGMYNYDNSIFDLLVLPDEVDRDVIVDNILMECAELELIYTDWDFMRFAIGQWSKKELRRWNDYAKVLAVDGYDPFAVYQRNGNYTDTTTRDLTYKADGTNTNSTSAWNEPNFTDREKNELDNTNTDKGTIVLQHEEEYSGIPSNTTKQDVIMKEMDLRNKYELDDMIINDFKRRFCLMVY